MAARATTPPVLQDTTHVPTAKERKYDRQLRLWAASGQQALEEARVLLLNAGSGAVGVETLKNLILPGIGSFTIVDEALVQEVDLGVNFFLSRQSLQKSRAEQTCELLKELNPEVRGNAVQSSIQDFIADASALAQYTLIILIGPSPHLTYLSSFCQGQNIPLIYLHSVGFYSDFSIQLPPQFPIVDTHPDPASTQDLRLLLPWPELLAFAKIHTANLEKLPDHEHGHVPYLLLLLHYLEIWKEAHEGKPPQNYNEKKEFTNLVRQGARTNTVEGGEENYDEAVSAVLKTLHEPSISSGLQEVFDSPDCQQPNSQAANFWLIAHAIAQFYKKHNLLPLPGTVPDMKAQSANYIGLQNVYKQKARLDVAEVLATVRSTEQALGRSTPITDAEVEAFCKGAAFVKLIKGRPLHFAKFCAAWSGHDADPKDALQWSEASQTLSFHLQLPPEETVLPVLLAFLAFDITAFSQPRSFTAGEGHSTFKADATKISTQLLTSLATQAGVLYAPEDATMTAAGSTSGTTATATLAEDENLQALLTKTHKILAEFERAGNGTAELHNISALTGGMVAQEIIKIITKQYIPVDNVCVFDGVESKTTVFRL